MKLKQITGATEVEFNATKPFQVLAVKITGTTDIDIEAIKATISINRKGGNEKNISILYPISKMSMLSSIGEGYNYLREKDGDIIEARIYINMTKGGSLALLPDEDMRLKFTGLNAAHEYAFYGLEVGVKTTECRLYKTLDVDGAADDKEYNVSKYEYAIFDSTKLTEVRGVLSNGNTFTFSNEELELFQMKLNDISYLVNANTTTVDNENEWTKLPANYKNMLVLPLRHEAGIYTKSVSITTNASSDIWVTWTEDVDKDLITTDTQVTPRQMDVIKSLSLPRLQQNIAIQSIAATNVNNIANNSRQ